MTDPQSLPLVSLLCTQPLIPKKKPWHSMTLWANAIVAVLMLFPLTKDFVSHYPIAVTLAITGANFLMRHFSHGKISLED